MSNYKITINELDPHLRDRIENCEGGKIEIPHNGRLYTNLSDLGLTNDQFLIDDIKTNLHLIVDMMEKFSICLLYPGISDERYNNLRLSIQKKFLDDLNIVYNDTVDYSVKITKFDSTRMPSTVEIIPNQRYQVFGMTVDRQNTTDHISKLSLIYGMGTHQYPISISANQDLNDYNTPCYCVIPRTNIAATVSNMPVAVAGSLEIIKTLDTHSFIQRFTPYENYGQCTYTRTYYKEADRWGNWSRNVTASLDGFLMDNILKVKGGTDSVIIQNNGSSGQSGLVFNKSDGSKVYELELKSDGDKLYMYDNTNRTSFFEYTASNRCLLFKSDTIKVTPSTENLSSTNLFRFHASDNLGVGVYSQSGGMYVIGAGEGAETFRTNFQGSNSDISSWNHGTENLILYADDHTRIMSNGQTWANRNQWIFAKDGTCRSPKSGFIGGTFFGTSDPASSTGLNGDTYIKY